MDIEGIGNLYKISNFINRETLQDNIDFSRVETSAIENSETTVQYSSPESILSNLKSIFAEYATTPVQESIFVEKPVEQRPLIVPTFKPTPKKIEVPEENKFNRILYGSLNNGFTNDTDKIQLLESIETLREELSRADVKLNTVPLVSETSPYNDIQNAHKILLHKKNMTMHYETARDVILLGVNQVINFCDGRETSWGHRPNLTGWDKIARFKLNALKHELSSLTSSFFSSLEIGPLMQIVFTLVPSALLHMTQTNIPKFNSENAMNNLYELDNKFQKK